MVRKENRLFRNEDSERCDFLVTNRWKLYLKKKEEKDDAMKEWYKVVVEDKIIIERERKKREIRN